MSTARIKQLREHGAQLFDKRGGLLELWQNMADNFYLERADFVSVRNLGDEFGIDMMTSYPAIARRDLGNAFGSMLRPSAKEWFKMRTSRPDREDTMAKQWLEWATKLQKNAMYERQAMFKRATAEGDQDFAAFGQCVISTEMNWGKQSLLYRNWHLRDVAWAEDEAGQVCTVFRKWKPTTRDMVSKFGDSVHPKVKKALEKNPYQEFDVWHIVMPTEHFQDMPDAKKIKQPYVSIFMDISHDHEMELVGQWTKIYTIPRWATVSGSQYAHSPATVAALPDARMIQAVTRVLLEAGEKATNPPMLAVQEAIRSDISIYAGGITWVDADYDERLGEVLRPISSDKSGLNFGMEIQNDIRHMISEAFFLNKLNLPPQGGPDMTAYEVGQRIQEYIRNALPLFEPMEDDYNGQMCEITFETLLHAGAFGRPDQVPKSIQGAEVEFGFESPLREATERIKANQFMEVKQALAMAIELDQSTGMIIDARKAIRDVFTAIAPVAWQRGEAEVDQMVAKQQQEVQQQQMLAMMQQGADIAATIGDTKMAGVA